MGDTRVAARSEESVRHENGRQEQEMAGAFQQAGLFQRDEENSKHLEMTKRWRKLPAIGEGSLIRQEKIRKYKQEEYKTTLRTKKKETIQVEDCMAEEPAENVMYRKLEDFEIL